MKKVKEILNYIFIDGISGMALGLFATLIIGTILAQIASFIPGQAGTYLNSAASIAKMLTGAGIAVGMSYKYKSSTLVATSAAVAGMAGGFAAKILSGAIFTDAGILLSGVGDPIGAFIGAFTAIQVGRLISGKTKLDIILTPAASIISGVAAGLLIGPPASIVTTKIGEVIQWGTDKQPVLMGIIVSVIMGICLTLPISSAALGIILGLGGLAGGAAVVGCSCQMVCFAVASYRENNLGGLVAQGIGTSMIQMSNILKHPQIWIPPIVASAILGPVSTKVLGMTCLDTGAGMGTSGLVGQFMTFSSMKADGKDPVLIIVEILLMHFILPAVLTLVISEFMRKKNFIKPGDMSLETLN